jgi:hypothetical protein
LACFVANAVPPTVVKTTQTVWPALSAPSPAGAPAMVEGTTLTAVLPFMGSRTSIPVTPLARIVMVVFAAAPAMAPLVEVPKLEVEPTPTGHVATRLFTPFTHLGVEPGQGAAVQAMPTAAVKVMPAPVPHVVEVPEHPVVCGAGIVYVTVS